MSMEETVRSESGQEQTEGAPQMGPLRRLWGVLIDPGRTFLSIDRKPTWLFPVIVLILVVIVSNALVADFRIQEARQRIAQNSQLTPEQREEIYDRMDEQQAQPFMKLLSYVIGPIVGVFFVIFLVSAALYFGATVILGGETSFKKVLAVYCWSSMVAIPGLLLKTPLMLLKKSSQVHTSLAALMPSGSEEGLLFKILTHTDLFVIWEIALISIGLAVIYRFATKKAAGLVIGWYLFYVVVAVAFSMLLGDRFMMG
jgi:hypothetical protein